MAYLKIRKLVDRISNTLFLSISSLKTELCEVLVILIQLVIKSQEHVLESFQNYFKNII